MRSLSASELLNIWEWGRTQPSWSRALRLLATACPETTVDMLSKLSIGQRDTLLLTLRERTFGSQLVSLAVCPSCGERLELDFPVGDIRVTPPAEPVEMLVLNVADYEISFRLPNSLDLMAICASSYTEAEREAHATPMQQRLSKGHATANASASHEHLANAQEILIGRCLLKAACKGEELAVHQLPPNLLDVVVEQIAQADPQADVQLALTCSACGHQWISLFDIVSFFWSEINAWVTRILREVHTLASAYGWREADILAMSPRRRQLYLEMVVNR